MKYFRAYPWGFQLLLFVLMIFTLVFGASAIMENLLPKITGYTIAQVSKIGPNSSYAVINARLLVQGVFSLSMYFCSAFLFAYLAHPSPIKYLGLQAPRKKINLLLAVLVMLGALPVLEGLSSLIGLIPFGTDLKAAQQANEDTFNGLLNMPSFAGFIKMFFVVAVTAGLGEELFFRGVLMRFSKQRSRSAAGPILFSALIFALSHSDIYGFLSIFLAGVLLAVIYNLTGSLWCSIVAHIFFNGSQIILSYIGNFSPAVKAFMSNTHVSIPMLVGGAALFAISFYLLWKNRTPLPGNWADDFTPEELKREENL